MTSIKLQWSNTTSQDPIVGYEIDYKLTSDILYIPLTYYMASDTFGEYIWNGASYNTSYDFRIRTKDVNNDYSTYRYVSISTDIIDNLPPETVDSYQVNFPTIDTLDLEFFNASDDFGIKGHEVSYKKTTDSIYTILPFILTPSGSFMVSIVDLEADTDYNIRVRTQDIYDVWSTTYFEIIESTEIPIRINRSGSNLNPDLSFTVVDACSLLTLGSNVLYSTSGVLILNIGDILYTNTSLTTPFNGLNTIWLIGDIGGNAGVLVNSFGKIQDIHFC